MDREALQEATLSLMSELPPFSAEAFGCICAHPESWGARKRRIVELGHLGTCTIVHDEREAPYVAESPSTLISYTDELDIGLLAWAEREPKSRLVGIGVDIASTSDFAGERGATFNHFIFAPREQELVRASYPDDEATGYACAFSAKEAAFKSLGAPLRSWYAKGGCDLSFDVLDFQLKDWSHEVGTNRKQRAQAAMDTMGVKEIRLASASVGEVVITFACAFEGK